MEVVSEVENTVQDTAVDSLSKHHDTCKGEVEDTHDMSVLRNLGTCTLQPYQKCDHHFLWVIVYFAMSFPRLIL
jgi:hypothetical protein